jgi:hypothetical protein
MAPIVCDATTVPPTRVFTPSSISIYVGDPPRELLIFTGVADPEWDSQSNLDYADVVVKLGPPTTDNFQYTSTVSLASISNTDSAFDFSADQSTVVNQPTGLELHVQIAVEGSSSTFSRFSYHVQVVSDLVKAKITGTIRWSQAAFGDPTSPALAGTASIFEATAGAWVFDPSAGGLGGSGSFVWKKLAGTLTYTPPKLGGGFWAVPYILSDVPLGTQMQVAPQLVGGMKTPPRSPIFAPPPRFVTLTSGSPSASGMDFELLNSWGVR